MPHSSRRVHRTPGSPLTRRALGVLTAAALVSAGLVAPAWAVDPTSPPAPPAEPTLVGNVTTSGGSAVEGATVLAFDQTTYETKDVDGTDATGRYELELPPGPHQLLVFPPDPNPLRLARTEASVIVPTSSTLTRDVEMRDGTFYGIVRSPEAADGSSAPVPNALVSIYGASTGSFEYGQAGSDGMFAIAAPPGQYAVTVRPPHDNPEGWAATSVPSVTVQAEGTALDLRLSRPSVRGKVLDLGGAPVPGSQVTVRTTDGSHTSTSADSASDGTYGLALAPGTYELRADPPYRNSNGLAHGVRTVTVGADGGLVDGQDIRLRRPNVSGEVRTPSGETVGNTFVFARKDGRHVASTYSDAIGRYSMLLDPGATYQLQAEPPASNPLRLQRAVRDVTLPADEGATLADQHLVLTMPSVVARVLMPTGETPVPHTSVSLRDARGSHVAFGQTDATGFVGFAADPGDYTVHADPPHTDETGLLAGSSQVSVLTGQAEPTAVDVRLEQATLFGTVFASDAETPAGWVELSLYDLDNRAPVDVGHVSSNYEGGYAFKVPPGRYLLSAWPFASASGAPVDRKASLEVVVGDTPSGPQDIVLAGSGSQPFIVSRLDVPATPGEAVEANARDAALSADGTTAVFVSQATNLLDQPVPDRANVFVRDLTSGTTELVSPRDPALEADAWASMSSPSLSADGRYVAFHSSAVDLVAGDPYGDDVFVYDRQDDVITLVSRDGDGAPAGGTDPVLSADGSTISFLTSNPALHGGATYHPAVVAMNLASGVVSPVTDPAAGTIHGFDMSADGQTFAWYEYTPDGWAVMRRGAGASAAEMVAIAYVGDQHFSSLPPVSLSDDGRHLAYEARVDGADGAGPATTLFRYDAQGGEPVAAATFPYGDPRGRGASTPLLSGNGAALSFVAVPPEARNDWDSTAWLTGPAGTLNVAPGLAGAGADARPTDVDASGERLTLESYTRLVEGGHAQDEGYSHVYLATRTDDTVAPSWDDPATALRADLVGSSLVRLAWTGARDDAGVAAYRLFRGTEATPLATLPTTSRSFTVEGLTPSTTYAFRIEAGDAAGNWSTVNPAVEVRTAQLATDGDAALIATAEPGGAVRLTWDADPTATGYRVLRKRGDQPFAAVKDVTTTAHTDSGLDAETAYTYSVQALDGSGARAHTQEVSVTTLPLGVPTFEAVLPFAKSGLLRLGGMIDLTVRGEPGRTVTVALTRTSRTSGEVGSQPAGDSIALEQPASLTVELPLVESPGEPGTYTGRYEIPLGTTAVTALEARLSDSAGHTATRVTSARLPQPVSGLLAVTADGPADTLRGARVDTSNEATFSGTRTPLPAEGAVDVALAEGTYGARLYAADGRRLAAVTGQQVPSGSRIPVTLSVPYQSTVSALVTASGSPVPDVPVTLSSADGGYLGYGRTDETGRVQLNESVPEGATVQARVTLPWGSPYDQPAATPPQVVGRSALTVPIVLSAPQPGTVQGLVRNSLGEPASDASVLVEMRRNQRTRSVQTTTGGDGRYSATLLAGPARVTISKNGETKTADIVLPEQGSATHDVDLVRPVPYSVDLKLFVQQPGQPVPDTPQPLDWRTAVHFGVSLSNGRNHVSSWSFPTKANNVVPLEGTPGDTLTFCANGGEAGLGYERRCASTVLGVERNTSLSLVLGGGSKITGEVRNADGSAPSGYEIVVDRLTTEGRERVLSDRQAGAPWSVVVPGAGSYLVAIQSGSSSAGATVEIGDGATKAVAPMELRNSDHFRGIDNAVTAVRSTALAGELANLRAGYHNTGTAVADAVLRVHVPAGVEAPLVGFLVDGKPATARAGDGFVDVALGHLASDATGAVRYALRMPADAAPGHQLTAAAEIRVPDAAAEPLLPATITRAGLTLDALETVSTREVVLSGQAPAGATVKAMEGQNGLGSVTATPGGYWRMPVTLLDRGPLAEYEVVVSSGSESLAQWVRYDGTRPQLTRIAVSQLDPHRADGREIAFDPRQGVARFPFVFVPGQTMVVKATFDQPNQVSDVVVRLGKEKATAVKGEDGVFVAEMPTGYGFSTGDISVTFESTVAPLSVDGPVPSIDAVRDQVPTPLAGFSILPAQPGDGSQTGSATASVSVPMPGEAEPAQLQITESVTTNVSYEPTAEDLANEKSSGSPLMGLEMVTEEDGSLVVTGYIPVNRLPANSPLLQDAPADSGDALVAGSTSEAAAASDEAASFGQVIQPLRAAGETVVNHPAVKVGMKLKPIAGPIAGLFAAFTSGQKYAEIGRLSNGLRLCSAEVAAPYFAQIDRLLEMAASMDKMRAAFMLSGALFSFASAGLAAGGVLALSIAALTAADIKLKAEIKAVAAAIAKLTCPDDDPDDPGQPAPGGPAPDKIDLPDPDTGPYPPMATPVWIYDPSGYVYEGVASNRLSGVTATLLYSENETGPWSVWDAEWYGQQNPLTTDAEGRYAWDVPEGWWKVEYTKAGYEMGVSDALPVLPPQLDVNEGLISLAGPSVGLPTVNGSTVEFAFDKHMRTASLPAAEVIVTNAAGETVAGTLEAVSPENAPGGGAPLARTFRWTPTSASAGAFTLTVPGGAQDYAGRQLGSDVAQPFTLTAPVTRTPYLPVLPERLLDTRAAGPQVGYVGDKPGAGQTVELQVTGVGATGVPADAAAVVLNVTGVAATANGFVTVWPCGTTRPNAASLNLVTSENRPNLVIAKIGTGGKVCLFTQNGAHLIADVNGFYPAGTDYTAVNPERLLDTRAAGPQVGYTGDKPTPGQTVELQVTGAGLTNVPADAAAVVLNVTGVQATNNGFLTVWPCGTTRPNAANLNLVAGGTRPNLVIAKIGAGGKVCVYSHGGAHLVADVNGYYPAGTDYTGVSPERLLDSRPGGPQVGYTGDKPTPGQTVELQVTGAGTTNVPADAAAAVLNITGVQATNNGFITVWPCGTPRPNTANLNLVAGGVAPNLVVSKIGTGGKVCLYTHGGAHLVADINGYIPAA